MKIIFGILLILTVCFKAHAQQAVGREIPGTYAPGLAHSRNFIKNPGAEKNVSNITQSASITTRTTSTPILGNASFSIDGTASGQTVKFDATDLATNLKGQSCEAKFTFTGDGTLYIAYAEQGSTKVTPNVTLTNTSNSRDVSLNFACGDLSSNSHLVLETTSASAAAIKVDDVYLGRQVSTLTQTGNGVRDINFISAGASESTACSSTPCTVYNVFNQNNMPTVTRSGVGTYTAVFPTNTWTTKYHCHGTPLNGAVAVVSNPTNLGTLAIASGVNGVGVADAPIYFTCRGY